MARHGNETDMHGILKVRKVLYIILLLFSSLAALSQPGYRYLPGGHKRIVDLEVHFRWDKHQLDMGYMGNDSVLARFARIIDSIGLDISTRLSLSRSHRPRDPMNTMYASQRDVPLPCATM